MAQVNIWYLQLLTICGKYFSWVTLERDARIPITKYWHPFKWPITLIYIYIWKMSIGRPYEIPYFDDCHFMFWHLSMTSGTWFFFFFFFDITDWSIVEKKKKYVAISIAAHSLLVEQSAAPWHDGISIHRCAPVDILTVPPIYLLIFTNEHKTFFTILR